MLLVWWPHACGCIGYVVIGWSDRCLSVESFSIWHILFHNYCALINCIVICLWKEREGCSDIFLSSLMQHLMQTKLNNEHSAWYVHYSRNASRYHKAAMPLQMLPSGASVDHHAVKCYTRWSVAEFEYFSNGFHVRKSTVWVLENSSEKLQLWRFVCKI